MISLTWYSLLSSPLQALRGKKSIEWVNKTESVQRKNWKFIATHCSPFNARSREKFSFFYLKWLILSLSYNASSERRIMRAKCWGVLSHTKQKKIKNRNSESCAGNLLTRFNFSHITPWCFTAAVHWFLSSGFSVCYSVVVMSFFIISCFIGT